MDTKIMAMAEKAIANIPPLKGHKSGVLDAGIRKDSNELVVILLDGRKMVFPIHELSPAKDAPNMRAKLPAPTMVNHQSVPPAPTANPGGGRSKKQN